MDKKCGVQERENLRIRTQEGPHGKQKTKNRGAIKYKDRAWLSKEKPTPTCLTDSLMKITQQEIVS